MDFRFYRVTKGDHASVVWAPSGTVFHAASVIFKALYYLAADITFMTIVTTTFTINVTEHIILLLLALLLLLFYYGINGFLYIIVIVTVFIFPLLES